MQYNFNFNPVINNWPLLVEGALHTLGLSIGAMIIGLLIAIICSWGKSHGPRILQVLIGSYIEIIRNTPFIIQLFFIYFGLPALGISMPPLIAALVAMFINLGAYATEIVRAGVESIPKGQHEAGLALNLKRHHIFLHIVLRPALKNVFPALSSQFIWMMLTSSIVSTISASDLASMAISITTTTFRSFEVYIIVTIIYFLLALSFMGLFKFLWRHLLYYPDGR